MICSDETRCGGRHLKIQDLTNPFWKETLTGNPTSKVITENKSDLSNFTYVCLCTYGPHSVTNLWQFTQRLTCKFVYLCVYIWANFEIKGLCRVLNNSGFCLMPVHTCVAECAWNVGYTRHRKAAGGVGGGGGPFLRMYLWWSVYTLYLHACQVRVIAGLCCCICVTSFER